METVITLTLDDQDQIGRPVRLEVKATDLGVSVTVLDENGRFPVADVFVEHHETQVRALVWTEHDLPAHGEDPSHEVVLVRDTTKPLAVPEPVVSAEVNDYWDRLAYLDRATRSRWPEAWV